MQNETITNASAATTAQTQDGCKSAADAAEYMAQESARYDWNKDSEDNARVWVSDGTMTHYLSEEQLFAGDREEFCMQEVAEAFTCKYDHGGMEDEFTVARIMDTADEELHIFAFDGHGNFEWNTRRVG